MPSGRRAGRAARPRRRSLPRVPSSAQPALLEHELFQPAVDRDPALKHLVLLIHQASERLLGDRDERHLVRHLEQREPLPVGLSTIGGMVACSADTEPDAGDVVVHEPLHEARCSSSVSWIPVVRSSSPPDIQGVGRAVR